MYIYAIIKISITNHVLKKDHCCKSSAFQKCCTCKNKFALLIPCNLKWFQKSIQFSAPFTSVV